MNLYSSEKFSIFSFVSIVSIIFLMILFVGNFMGLLYILEGNFALALLGSILMLILYVFIIRVLVEHKQDMKDKPFGHFSYIFWFFYLAMAAGSFFLLVHFVNVEYNVKESIKQDAFDKIAVVDKALGAYEKEVNKGRANFETGFQQRLYDYKTTGDRSLLITLQEPPYSIDERFLQNREYININGVVNQYMETLNDKMDMDLKVADSVMRQNNAKYRKVFSDWERLRLMDTYSGLNTYIEDTERELNSKLDELPFPTQNIDLDFDRSTLPLNNPSELNSRFKPDFMIPVGVVLIIHFFLILPFIFKPVRVYNKSSKNDDNFTSYSSNNYSSIAREEEIMGGAGTGPSTGLNTEF